MFLSISCITSKEQLRNLALSLIADRFPHNVWTRVYADGSAEREMKNGGSEVYIRYPDGDTTSLSVPGGFRCSNHQAEILAICTAAGYMLESGKQLGNIAIFTDSLSTLQALNSADSTRWSRACTIPLPSWQLSFRYPPVGVCTCRADRKRKSRQTQGFSENRQSGFADTEPCHLQIAQDTSPLPVQCSLEERKLRIPGTPWRLEGPSRPLYFACTQGTVVWVPIWRGLAFRTLPCVSLDMLTKAQATSFSPAQNMPRDVS